MPKSGLLLRKRGWQGLPGLVSANSAQAPGKGWRRLPGWVSSNSAQAPGNLRPGFAWKEVLTELLLVPVAAAWPCSEPLEAGAGAFASQQKLLAAAWPRLRHAFPRPGGSVLLQPAPPQNVLVTGPVPAHTLPFVLAAAAVAAALTGPVPAHTLQFVLAVATP